MSRLRYTYEPPGGLSMEFLEALHRAQRVEAERELIVKRNAPALLYTPAKPKSKPEPEPPAPAQAPARLEARPPSRARSRARHRPSAFGDEEDGEVEEARGDKPDGGPPEGGLRGRPVPGVPPPTLPAATLLAAIPSFQSQARGPSSEVAEMAASLAKSAAAISSAKVHFDMSGLRSELAKATKSAEELREKVDRVNSGKHTSVNLKATVDDYVDVPDISDSDSDSDRFEYDEDYVPNRAMARKLRSRR